MNESDTAAINVKFVQQFNILLQLLGDFVPRTAYRALPLDPTGGTSAPHPPTHPFLENIWDPPTIILITVIQVTLFELILLTEIAITNQGIETCRIGRR